MTSKLFSQLKDFNFPIFFKLVILIITGVFILFIILIPLGLRQTTIDINTGDVSPRDITAPQSISYVSDVLTKQAQEAAVDNTQPVYLPIDLTITRKQLQRLQNVLNFIENVISDSNSNQDEKISDLTALSDIRLKKDSIDLILSMDSLRWKTVKQETARVFEQIMRNPIKDYQVEKTKQEISSYISFSITEDQSNLIVNLIEPFITPNSIYSEEATLESQIKARSQITPITRTFVQGEKVIDNGKIITRADIEALEHLGLVTPQLRLQDIIAALSIVAICTAFTGLYFHRRKFSVTIDARSTLAISLLFIIFVLGAHLSIPGRVVIPYLFPIAAFGLTIASLFNVEIGLILSLIISIIATYSSNDSFDLGIYYSISSLCGVLILGRGYRIASFFWSGIVIGFAGSACIIAFRLTSNNIDLIGVSTLIGTSFLNGFASASIALILQFFFSQLLGLTTALRLLDLSRSDFPLQKFILFNAPGTYQHSLQVANLAERAAEAIGADALLVRVGAIYHDAGKALNPQYFIENQIPGSKNPHDHMDPAKSASVIIKHVSDGVKLAKKHRLPSRIQDFILEHHGTLLTRYQYARAVEKKGELKTDQNLFRYNGPKPRSKETAILMLADGCEAKARAELPKDEKELSQIIQKVIDYAIQDGQFSDTPLTFKDLNIICNTFTTTLINTHHPRILYPELDLKKSDSFDDSLNDKSND